MNIKIQGKFVILNLIAMILSPQNLTDNELLVYFENCSLPTNQLSHEIMLKLAWTLIKKYGLELAIVKNRELKENYFLTALKSDKFNATLSRAYVEILYHFMKKSKANSFEKLIKEYPRLRFDFKKLIKTHYGYDILKQHRKEEAQVKSPILFNF